MAESESLPQKKDLDSRSALLAPLTYCPGVGPKREIILRRLGLFRTCDLLFFFPRDYQDLTHFTPVDKLQEGELQTVAGQVVTFNMRRTFRGPIVTLLVEDENGDSLEAIWFNQPWMTQNFERNRRVFMTGKPTLTSHGWQMSHPRLIWRSASEEDRCPTENSGINGGQTAQDVLNWDPFLPIYPLTEGLQQFHLHRILKSLLVRLPDELEDVLPADFRGTHSLLAIADAVRQIHFPKSLDEAKAARRRFIYQELFLLQLALTLRRRQHEVGMKAPVLHWSAKIDARIRRLFSFDFTDAQNRVVREISEDMNRPIPMNRLLQGDVGSGKTAVAAYAMCQAAANGFQAVLMAPTEVLARQHIRFLTRLLENSPVRIVPLLGGQKTKEREEILRQIREGEANLIVGTQAIVCNEIDFHRLGLVVIDEQHKFGVRQRAHLKTGTDGDPHYLVMTATPIPRSVTMTIFGDLETSIIDALPPGRQPVHTYVVEDAKKSAWWDFFRKKIAQGRQGYIVVPRVEEKEDEDLHNVTKVYEELSAGELRGLRLGILHGRMTAEEKERIMRDFRSREIEVLISTSVIEVGVDIPNASLMTIEDGNMFGLAQLHQLRGRIGRGKHPGYCAVFYSPKKGGDGEGEEKTVLGKKSGKLTEKKKKKTRKKSPDLGENPEETPEERTKNDPVSRLKIFAESTDGFYLAEKDFEMRGPGDLFGTDQHGLCRFRIANLVRDQKVVAEARRDAEEMLKEDPGLSDPAHNALRRQVLARYGNVLNLGDVG